MSTTYVKLLRLGDVIYDEGDFWEVTRNPQIEPDGRILLYLRPFPRVSNTRSRAYVFDARERVRIHHQINYPHSA